MTFTWPWKIIEVQSCSSIAKIKNTDQLPDGKLTPLPISKGLWVHTDCVTYLPPLLGFTKILAAVDSFLKACCFIKQTSLPTTFQGAERLSIAVYWRSSMGQDSQFISNI